MSCAMSLCFLKPVLLVAAVGGIGMAGYNYATTGCPLGSCSTEQSQTVTAASRPVTDGGCPMGGCSEESEQTAILASAPVEGGTDGACPMGAGSCSESMPAGHVQMVALEGSAECAGAEACDASKLADCEKECAEVCDPAACETECPHALPAGQVADGEAKTASNAG